MDPNQQPQDFSKPNEPAEIPPAPQTEAPGQANGFSQPPLPASDVSSNPEITTPAPQSFGQPTEANPQYATPHPAFPAPEVAPVGQPPLASPVANTQNPGQLLGIISIVLSIIGLSVVGIILGIISRNKSKAAGASATLGTAGMVLGIVFTVIGFLILGLVFMAYGGIQQRAQTTMAQSSASSLLTHAEAYSVSNNGTYPASSADIDTSSLSKDIKVVETTPTSSKEIQYLQCDGGSSAQVIYYDATEDMVRIMPLGLASSTEACA